MSKSKFDSDGFQIISSKRSSKKSTKLPPQQTNFVKEEIHIDVEKTYRRILSAIEDLKTSEYLSDVNKAVSNNLKQRKVVEIVCFGLGHIGECTISQYQLGLLLCLKDILKPDKVFVHDPIFYVNECQVLKKFGLEIIEQNQEGSYIISDQEITLVYLPHCPKQLANNFLWSNWGLRLENCVLMCNSFTSLIENHPNRILAETVPYIYRIFPHTTEIALENNFTFRDIFNDTSLHIFEKHKLDLLSYEFWIKNAKPNYENTEEFITSLMVEKLNL
ncbi:SRR1-like protein isoform X1 [Epargyreus clarus]|uniref:SRR1-like protein isoform X1 n=1 Tax=Epargyreus clarus TaxID=520877 RepID=UPI003C2CDECF